MAVKIEKLAAASRASSVTAAAASVTSGGVPCALVAILRRDGDVADEQH
jgi:hypothetical protein